jgi:hypothetical protein
MYCNCSLVTCLKEDDAETPALPDQIKKPDIRLFIAMDFKE